MVGKSPPGQEGLRGRAASPTMGSEVYLLLWHKLGAALMMAFIFLGK